MDCGFNATIALPITPSRALLRVADLLHLGCLVAVVVTYPHSAGGLLVGAATATSWLRVRRAVTSPSPFTNLILDPDDAVFLVDRAGEQTHAEYFAGRFVAPWLTVVEVRAGPVRATLRFTPDNTAPAAFRRLRVRLRLPRGSAGR